MTIKSREDYRKQKELEEARKAGLAPAEVDRDGNEINPHIPQYITKPPFYLLGDDGKQTSLDHQRIQKRKKPEGSKSSSGSVVVNKCENCRGNHNKKDCLQRPRKIGAKWTNKYIAPDDKMAERDEPADYDGKRDRWDGYDAATHACVTQRRFEAMENARKEFLKKQKLKQLEEEEEDDEDDDEDEDDEAKADERKQVDFAKVEKRVRTTGGGSTGSVRNLRIREDTAKYLLNLDVNSAHYDPKTRSMREDPLPDMDPNDKFYAGDNHSRLSGQAVEVKQLHIHAWEAFEKGHDVHMQAAPTQAELLHRNAKAGKEKLKGLTKESIEAKYGNAASGEKLPVELLLGQSEGEIEYDRAGRIIKGQEAAVPRSKYEVDAAYVNNHTSVWGSWWRNHKWGYKCCQQTIKNSYCTGLAGIQAAAAAAAAQIL